MPFASPARRAKRSNRSIEIAHLFCTPCQQACRVLPSDVMSADCPAGHARRMCYAIEMDGA